ncbi:MAG: leucine-rich repeat protein, partial [Cyanobacteria bacterium P01_E01_bin.48]
MSDQAYAAAEEKIAEALQTGATELDLSGKWHTDDSEKLTELPESLGQLTQLRSLDLGGNQLTALPECLGQLTQLQTLNLSGNQLTVLPECLGQLTQLQTLNLSNNQLTTLPELTQLQTLNLSNNQLTTLPESLGQLTQLQELDLSNNQLTTLPESLGQLTQLQEFTLFANQLTELPEWIRHFSQLQKLDVSDFKLTSLPEWVFQFQHLKTLWLTGNQLTHLPDALGNLSNLKELRLGDGTGSNPLVQVPPCIRQLKQLELLGLQSCQLVSVPDWLGEQSNLRDIWLGGNEIVDLPPSMALARGNFTHDLANNPLNPELAAACGQGLDAVKAYLRAKAEAQITLNEAKLILIGEGEVGKSCLLDALRDAPWQKHESTHGIEIKPVQVTHRYENGSATEITLNTWDFGGQKVYRPTHQFFFSAPAVYLVVWKPREGPQQGAVEYWINTIKHRAGADAKILIVGTHGGPQQRQPDIDLQDLRDKFGADCVLGAFHVNSQPEGYDETNEATWNGERTGIAELKAKIAEVAAALPNVGRSIATSWNNVLQAVKHRSETDPYLTYAQFEELCQQQTVEKVLAKTYAGMLNQLGYVIHYGDANDDLLQQIMILKPDWLAKAISFVLDDEMTRKRNGLVSHGHLSHLWSHPPYDYEAGYPTDLHPLFLKLMERFDISYEVVVDSASNQPTATSLIAQLVKDQTPEELPEWDEYRQPGDQQKRQICQIVEKERNQSANAEGLFYRLIARLHKYSLGRDAYDNSV